MLYEVITLVEGMLAQPDPDVVRDLAYPLPIMVIHTRRPTEVPAARMTTSSLEAASCPRPSRQPISDA